MKRAPSAFQTPKHTQVPNEFFPMIPDMEESELKVTLVMIRETFGWHRQGFQMSINEMAAATGLSRNGTKAGARAAQARGTFLRVNPDSSDDAIWKLNVEEPDEEPAPGPIPPDEPDPGQPVTTPSASDQGPGQPVTTPTPETESKKALPPSSLNKELKKSGALVKSSMPDPRWNFDTMGNYTDYPSDVWEYLIEFCVCFNFSAPSLPKKKGNMKESSRGALWIRELRELKDACRPIGVKAIRYYRWEFERYMVEHEPHVGPHDVDKPGSIKNKIAGMVAKIQSKEYTPLKESPWQLWKEGKWISTPKQGQNGQPDQAAPLVNKKF